MAISTMYPAMPGSPKTTLTADITADATSLTVADGNVLPTAPNILVIGDDENAEVIGYNSKSGNILSGLVRALGGTIASAWTAGTEVARNFTSFDHDRFKENIEDLATNKADAADVYTQTEIDTLLNAKQNSLTFDSTPTASSTNPVTSGGIKSALDAKVSKSGDTMTGDLIVSDHNLNVKRTNADISASTIAQSQYAIIGMTDKNDRYIGYIQASNDTSGSTTITVASRKYINNSSINNGVSLSVNASGVRSVNVNDAEAWRNALGASNGVWPTDVGGTGGTDSGWQSYTDSNVFTGTIYYRKVGAFFMIGGQTIKLANALTAGNSLLLMTLSSAYRPAKEIMPSCFINTGLVQNRVAPMRLTTSGGLYLYANKTDDIATTYSLYFSGFGFM